MAIYQGDTKVSGNAKVSSLPLFTTQWQDHITNDASWLRSEPFSWQSGAVYVSAYNHLVADVSGITSETETIAGTTITFKRATDGHKIVDDTQVSNVEAIYNATGVAWYYILDTTNQRFKLPRSSHGNIVEKYQNGTNWYRLWSDGFCEQGGVVSVAQTPEGQDVNLLKPYGSTNYTLSISLNTVAASWSAEANPRAVQGLTSFHIQSGGVVNPSNMSWISYGFLSTTPENPQYKYLYFYVGNTIQNETSVDVAELAEELNDKADADLANLSNGLTNTICMTTPTTVSTATSARPAVVVENYVNGTSWYRVWSDGWCEQGGTITGDYVQVYFLKPYANANYNIQVTINSSTEVAAAYAAVGVRGNVTSTYFELWGGSTVGYKFWMTSGYISLS